MKFKKILSLGLASILTVSLLAGCVRTDEASMPDTVKETTDAVYAFVAKDIENLYMQKVYEGFEKACSEAGAIALYKGPNAASVSKQIEVIDKLIEEKVDGIAIAANDADALEEILTKAMNSGIKVVSLDSAVNKNSRQVHIQQADPEQIGRTLIQSAYNMVNGHGGIAILSATENAPNQNLWIEYMKKEISENNKKYADTPIVKIVYGNDDPTKSASETQSLLLDPAIKVIVAPTIVGMLSAAEVLQSKSSSVKLTGLGLPSEMAPYINDDTCPLMYLWNPIDIGYLAGHAIHSLSAGDITGTEGESFKAGSLGERTIVPDKEGGTEIILGAPYKFDYTNIAEWQNIY